MRKYMHSRQRDVYTCAVEALHDRMTIRWFEIRATVLVMPIVCCCYNFHSTLSTWQARWERFFFAIFPVASYRIVINLSNADLRNQIAFVRSIARPSKAALVAMMMLDKNSACIIAFVFVHRNSNVRSSWIINRIASLSNRLKSQLQIATLSLFNEFIDCLVLRALEPELGIRSCCASCL